MGRRAPASDRVTDQRTAPRSAASRARRGVAGRALPLLGLALVAVLVLAGCGENQPYTTTTPRTENARDIQFLYQVLFWAALVVFIGVQAAIVYVVLRFRRRGDERPEQVHGNRRLEISWTIIPAIVLLAIFIPTARTLYDFDADAKEGDIEIDVYGKQWWWEIHYPEELGVITANEVRVPAGQEVIFNLRSNNVIHSFWVPQLTGKMDVIPGHDNRLSVKADIPGEYFGECAEFCGAAHAWMRFKVIVEPQETFDAWVAAWKEPPPVPDARPETADVVDAPAAFGACLACHNISGTNARLAQTGITAHPKSEAAGPNLTLLGCRDHIAAGLLENAGSENQERNLRMWLTRTDEVKEGNYMPNYYKNGQIDDAQVDELVAYLMSLKPAGGCPPEQPVGGDVEVASE